ASGDDSNATITRIRFEVEDTGIGIPDECIEKLFHSYSQADASTTRHYGGTGLGLAICKQIVELMGGEIGVISTPEAGATFWFVVPLGRAAESALDSASPGAASPAPSAPQPQPTMAPRAVRILVAEDNEINQMVAVELLRSAGWEAETVATGAEAVQALATRRFDLVLMDCHMPGMDGLAATAALRAAEEAGQLQTRSGASLPIIALTAQAVVGDRQRCLDAGMNDYITKPISPAALFGAIGRALKIDSPSGLTPPKAEAARWEPTPAGEAIDLDQLSERFQGDREFVAGLLGTFSESARRRVQQLATSVTGDSTRELVQLAHGLKGAAANVSAIGLSRAATDLEAAALANRVHDYPRLQQRVERELVRCQEAIDGLLAGA
ncbi:MAG TPA: response regulator, partial [Lacipirellulaceae bacterium]|nr:response regulator [Lacipirellulaceae bacterium]